MTKSTPKKAQQWEVLFVRCELDKDTKQHVKAWDPKFEHTFAGLDRLVTDGYKVSVSYDKYHDCVGVFCTMPDQGHKHHGQCLTARGPDWLAAIKVLVYKHFTVLGGDWGVPVDQKADRDEWG